MSRPGWVKASSSACRQDSSAIWARDLLGLARGGREGDPSQQHSPPLRKILTFRAARFTTRLISPGRNRQNPSPSVPLWKSPLAGY